MLKNTLILVTLFLPFASFARPLKTQPILVKDTVTIDKSRLVVLKGDIDDGLIAPAVDAIKKLDDESKKPIYIVINSRGGSVESGFSLIETMESASSPIICIVETKAYSMAALISTYCPTLYLHKFAMMMFHEASYSVQGSTTQVRARIEATEKYLNQLFVDVAANLNITPEQFRAKIHHEWWLTAREAVNVGIGNAVIRKLKYPEPEPRILNIFEQFFKSLLPNLDVENR